MNYVAQMNAFWSWRLLNQLNSRAADLYMALLHFNNLGGWQKEFTVSSTMLQSVCGISRTELSRHRNTLIQMGLISYQGGKGSRSGFYQIFDLCIVYRTQTDTQPVTQLVTQTDTQPVTQSRAEKKVYINNIINNKQNKTKQENDLPAREDLFKQSYRLWETNVGSLTPILAEKISELALEVGFPVLKMAIERSLERGKRTFAYIQSVARNIANGSSDSDGKPKSNSKPDNAETQYNTGSTELLGTVL